VTEKSEPRYLVINGSDSVERLKAYLYDNAALIASASTTGRYGERIAALVEIVDRAGWDAEAQAERLGSGLYGVTPPVSTAYDAASQYGTLARVQAQRSATDRQRETAREWADRVRQEQAKEQR
jgi:hypothetical protein